jgi:hypothetical protein
LHCGIAPLPDDRAALPECQLGAQLIEARIASDAQVLLQAIDIAMLKELGRLKETRVALQRIFYSVRSTK